MKIKLIVLFSIIFLVSGCDITYNLEINNQEFKENINIIEKDKSKWNSNISSVTAQEFYDIYKNKPIPISENAPVMPESDDKLENVNYYNSNDLTNDNQLGLEYDYTLTQSEFNESYFVHYAYNRFLVGTVNGNIIISTGEKFKLFEQFNNLENVTVNITTNHKVVDDNADEVNGNTYTWHITEGNADDKSIYLELTKEEYIDGTGEHSSSVIMIIVVVILAIAGIGALIYLYLKRKHQKSNEL